MLFYIYKFQLQLLYQIYLRIKSLVLNLTFINFNSNTNFSYKLVLSNTQNPKYPFPHIYHEYQHPFSTTPCTHSRGYLLPWSLRAITIGSQLCVTFAVQSLWACGCSTRGLVTMVIECIYSLLMEDSNNDYQNNNLTCHSDKNTFPVSAMRVATWQRRLCLCGLRCQGVLIPLMVALLWR